jgi:hypothetical protein
MTVLTSRSFNFRIRPFLDAFMADADFIAKPHHGPCAFCPRTAGIQVVYCRASIRRVEDGEVTLRSDVGGTFYSYFPQGVPFCSEHTDSILCAIREGILQIQVPVQDRVAA